MANLSDRYTELGLSLGAAGGGGGGGFNWNEPEGSAPIREELAGELSYKFAQGQAQKLVGWVKVPDTYNAGNQIEMSVGFELDSAGTDDVRLETLTTLIKAGEAVDGVTNQHTSTAADVTLSGTNKALNLLALDLTDGSGAVNSVAVAAGDLLRVELSREAPGGTEDSNDLILLPSVTEVSFA